MTVDRKNKVIRIKAGTLTIRLEKDWPVPGMMVYDKGLKRWRLDAKGWTLDASGHVDNRTREIDDEGRAPALRIKLARMALVDLRVKGSPNGVAINADGVLLHGCRFLKIGEDALNLHGVKNCWITDCVFDAGTDKLLQANDSTFMVRGCKFAQCTNAVRVMGGEMLDCADTVFDKCNTAVHVTENGVARMGTGNVFRGVKIERKTESGGRFR